MFLRELEHHLPSMILIFVLGTSFIVNFDQELARSADIIIMKVFACKCS